MTKRIAIALIGILSANLSSAQIIDRDPNDSTIANGIIGLNFGFYLLNANFTNVSTTGTSFDDIFGFGDPPNIRNPYFYYDQSNAEQAALAIENVLQGTDITAAGVSGVFTDTALAVPYRAERLTPADHAGAYIHFVGGTGNINVNLARTFDQDVWVTLTETTADSVPVLLTVDISDPKAVRFTSTGASALTDDNTTDSRSGVTLEDLFYEGFPIANISNAPGDLTSTGLNEQYQFVTNTPDAFNATDINFSTLGNASQAFTRNAPAFTGEMVLNLDGAEFMDVGETGFIFAQELSSYRQVVIGSYQIVSVPDAFELGDMNGDGTVTNGDIAAFVKALTDPPGYLADFPGLDPDSLGDFTGDGLLTNGDIASFVARLVSPSPVPEPASLTVLVLGGVIVARRRTRV